MATEHRQTGEKERIAERRTQVFALRLSGASYRQIGKQLGITPDTAWRDVTAVLKELQERSLKTADLYRTLELERLDTMLLSIMTQVRNGNLSAIDRALRISDQRCKLLGLNRPELTLTKDVTEMSDDELRAIVEG